MLRKLILTTSVAILMGSSIGLVYASSDDDMVLKLNDTKRAQITKHLTEQGYEVGKIKTDDGLYEAYAKKDGEKFEIFLNDKMEVQYIKGGKKPKLNDDIKMQITKKLEDQGYQVGKIKTEDGLYEAYARKNGEKIEIKMDRDLNIVRTEIDD